MLFGRPRLYLDGPGNGFLEQGEQLLRRDVLVVERLDLDVLCDDIVNALLSLLLAYFVDPLDLVSGESPNDTRQVLQVSAQQILSGHASHVHLELLPQNTAAGVVVQCPDRRIRAFSRFVQKILVNAVLVLEAVRINPVHQFREQARVSQLGKRHLLEFGFHRRSYRYYVVRLFWYLRRCKLPFLNHVQRI